jgi:hypothetical protein
MLQSPSIFSQNIFCALIFFRTLIFEVRMSAHLYRKNAEECLDRAADARKSEDSYAWLSMAEDWLRLAVDLDVPEQEQEEVLGEG